MKQQGKTYHFLGLNAADTSANAKEFVKKYSWTWPSIVDPQRTRARRFGVTYQPAVLLVDAQGRFVGGFQGRGTPALWNNLKGKLRAP